MRVTVAVAEISTEDGPQPWVCGDALAERAALLGPLNQRGTGGQVPYDPGAALAAAERQARRRLLRADRLDVLHERLQITPAELRAGHEIAAIHRWRAGLGLPGVASQLGAMVDGAGPDAYGDAWLAWIEAEHTRYAPWSAWAMAFQVKAAPAAFLADLTLLVAVEGLGLRQVAGRLAMDQRRAHALLRRSLAWYAHHAGWIASPEPLEIAA